MREGTGRGDEGRYWTEEEGRVVGDRKERVEEGRKGTGRRRNGQGGVGGKR